MRILALVGPGTVGRVAVARAARLPGRHEITVGDRDLGAARRLALELSDADVRLAAREVDVTHPSGLAAALEEADVVLNAGGAYDQFGPAVLWAAIRTRTHYLDVCDDWESTVRMLELDGDARAAGVCAVLGMGASPGISNLLAARAVARLDEVTDLYTALPLDLPPSGLPAGTRRFDPRGGDGRRAAAAVHLVRQISGRVAEVSNGNVVCRPPLRPVTLTLPGGRTGTAYTVGHPEPVTLQRSFRPTGNAANLIVTAAGTVAYLDVLRSALNAGRLTTETAAADLARPAMGRTARAALRAARFRSPGSLPAFFATATGARAGRSTTVLAYLTAAGALTRNRAEATGIAAALGLAQLLDGTTGRPGVHPPEVVIDADRFFVDLERHTRSVLLEEEQATAEEAPDGLRDQGVPSAQATPRTAPAGARRHLEHR